MAGMSEITPASELDVPVSVPSIQRFYSGAAPQYEQFTDQYEAAAKARGVELLDRQPGERYLEVAVGGGGVFTSIIESSGIEGVVGVDLSAGMLAVTAERLRGAGHSPPLIRADARGLPFPDESFDCVFNSYMLDLIPNDVIPRVLAEFRRVLRPGGRLVLVNLTEGEGADAEFSADWKRRYQDDPMPLGACRPVVVAPSLPSLGFGELHREYVGGEGRWPAELVRVVRA